MRTTYCRLRLYLFVIAALLFLMPIASRAASDSSGKDFFIAFQQNYINGGNLSLFITGKNDTYGTVEIPGLNFSTSFTVQANKVTTVNIPASAQLLGSNIITKRGIRVTAQDEVSIYGLNQKQYTTDAFLALPSDILGLEYIAMSYHGALPSQIAVVGVFDNTTVTINPSAPASGRASGVPFEIQLNSGDTYQIRGAGASDLTGTFITASAPVALMSGVECVNIPIGIGYCDHIVEMMPPVATWGKSYLTVPLATRLRGDVFRILAAEDDTKVYINSVLKANLNRGKYFETVLTARSLIEASAPVLVAQYSPGQDFDSVISDPFMMLIPPTEQFLNQYTFSTPATGFTKNYVNVVVPTSAVSSLILDGMAVNSALFPPVGSSGFSGGQVPISLGSHTITGDVPFGIYVYGFGSYDSYGYPGGMAFEFINPIGDTFLPNVKLNQINDVIWGTATDSEDINADGVLDSGEDLNCNGLIDRRSEDVNGDGKLDPEEDLNGNGFLDRDTGIFKVELEPGSTNLQLTVLSFVPGALSVNFSITLVDPTISGAGTLRIVDGVGNEIRSPISQSLVPNLMAVRVIDTLSTANIEVDINSFSKVPYSVTNTNDTLVIEWRYDSFPANLSEDIGFDIILKDPVPGEQRLVTHKVELLYNDLNGNPVRTDLGPLNVNVLPSVFDGEVATDKPVYGPNENAAITAAIENLSQYPRTVDVKILVEDAAGTVMSQEIFQGVIFAAGVLKNFTIGYATGTSFAGDYRAHLLLFENGAQVSEASSPFKISPVKGVTSDVTTNKALYGASEPVSISSVLRSTSPNYSLQDITARITLADPLGKQVFLDEKPIKTLLPQQTTQLKTYWNTGASPKGRYTVLLQVFDGSGTLATSSAVFVIAGTATTGSGIHGTITAQPSSVQQGEDESIDYSITNAGNEDITDLPVNILIANAVTLELKRTIPMVLSLPVSAVNGETIAVSTDDLAPGKYLALLQIAPSASQPKTLARATFEVVIDLKPKLEVTKNISGRGNVLVWLNYPWESGQNCPNRVPIERALRESGVLYRIVTEKNDFEKEIRNPLYTDFVILGDHQPMEDHFSEELREQINRGKGLVASMFSRRNLDGDLFGVNLSGYLPGGNYALELLPSDISAGTSFNSSGRALRAEVLDSEENVGWQVEETRNGTVKHPGAIVRQYGSGKVVFLTFDLGLTSSNYDPFALLFADSLHHVHSPVGDLLPGQPVPVEVTLRTLAGNLNLKFDEIFPPQVTIFDTETGLELTNPWTTDLFLMLNEGKSILYNAVLPREKGTYTLTSDISYADGGMWKSYGTYPLDLVVERNTYDLLDEISFEIDMLSPTLNSDRINIAAAQAILAKMPNYEDGNRSVVEIQQIIHELLKAVNAITAIQSVEVTEIRGHLDRLLSIFEARWYALQ
jgi:hypothetical protein